MFKELTVTHELSSKKMAEFVVVGDSGKAPYKYGDTVVIPYLEGVLFSGCVINTKKIQAYQTSASAQLFWKVTCADDFSYLEREICRNIAESDYTNVFPSELLKTILGDSWWMPRELTGGTYDCITDLGNKTKITYNPNNQSKSEAVVNILAQTGYEWRVRRPTYKTKVTGFTQYGTTARLRFSPSLPMAYLDRYVITTNSSETVPIYSQVIFVTGDSAYDYTCRINQVEDSGDIELTNIPTDMEDRVSVGDEFIITFHPILEASPILDNVCDREFTVNEDLFQFDIQEDESSRYNAITVRTLTYDGEAYTSYLPAIYYIDDSTAVWSNCTYVNTQHDNSIQNGYPDAYVASAYIDGNNMCVMVEDENNSKYKFASGEWVSFGGKRTSRTIQPPTSDTYGYTTLRFQASDFNGNIPQAGMPILRSKIHVEDIASLGLSSGHSIAIGNEIYPYGIYSIDATNNLISLPEGTSLSEYRKSPHMTGVLVRNHSVASEPNTSPGPQPNSPAAHFGFLKVKAENATSGNDPALADRIATTALATGCVSEVTGKGTVIYTDFYKVIDSGEITNQILEVGDVIRIWHGSTINPDGTPNPSGLVSEEFRISNISFAVDSGKVDIQFGNSPESIGNHLVSINTTIGRV